MNTGFIVLALAFGVSLLLVAANDTSNVVSARALAAAEAERVAQELAAECSRGSCAAAALACAPGAGRTWTAAAQDETVQVVVRREWEPALFAGWATVVHVAQKEAGEPVQGQWSCP